MVFTNVIVDVSVRRRSSVISQSSVQISASLTGTVERILYGGGGGANKQAQERLTPVRNESMVNVI